jgi:glycosyltransferase involved in cell wall biosynthesis
MQLPLISVVIPVYNREVYLQKTLDSVKNQTYPNIEVIIVDDGSTDGSGRIAKQNKDLVYLNQTNQGPAAARNTGIKAARASLITFLDSDDIWDKRALSTLYKGLLNNSKIHVVEGMFQNVEYLGAEMKLIDAPRYSCFLGSILVKREVFEKVGYFNEQLILAEDIDWYVRCWEHGIIKERVNFITTFYRQHKKNITHTNGKALFYRSLMYQSKIERQRTQGIKIHPFQSLNDYMGSKM